MSATSTAAPAELPTRVVVSAGIVLFRRGAGNSIEIFLISEHSGNWGVPKGRLEADETVEQAARRELKEETGFDVEAVRRLTFPACSCEQRPALTSIAATLPFPARRRLTVAARRPVRVELHVGARRQGAPREDGSLFQRHAERGAARLPEQRGQRRPVDYT